MREASASPHTKAKQCTLCLYFTVLVSPKGDGNAMIGVFKRIGKTSDVPFPVSTRRCWPWAQLGGLPAPVLPLWEQTCSFTSPLPADAAH